MIVSTMVDARQLGKPCHKVDAGYRSTCSRRETLPRHAEEFANRMNAHWTHAALPRPGKSGAIGAACPLRHFDWRDYAELADKEEEERVAPQGLMHAAIGSCQVVCEAARRACGRGAADLC